MPGPGSPSVSARCGCRCVRRRVRPLALALLGLLVVRALAEAGSGIAQVAVTTRVALTLRERLTRQVFALGVAGARRHLTGDLVARMTGNAAAAAT
ncbi:hypothetical protein ACGFIV_34805 [Sphaerisporangium sp. NPDC049003]|uniref:hypothetical protein n=1 Tax=Sphaerisporangium sp. NPDC049003 TaxID=3364517 RepID=UPI003712435C